MAVSIIFTAYTRNGFKKLQCEQTFILCKVSKSTYSYRTPLVGASEYSRNLEFEKWTDQNLHLKKKTLLKQCQKEFIYEYILAFAGWWSNFWEVICSGEYILTGGGWWWLVVSGSGWWWIYFCWWWVVVGGGGYILTGGGWWWMVVGRGGCLFNKSQYLNMFTSTSNGLTFNIIC